MKQKVIFIILIIIFLSQVNIRAEELYLGSFTPRQDNTVEFFVPFQNTDFESLSLFTKDDYFRYENKKIKSLNLKLLTRDGAIPLNTRKINLDRNSLSSGQSFNFKLDLKTNYEPGFYKNILYLETENKIIEELEISFEIKAWMDLLNGSTQNAKIENLNRKSLELLSSGQQKLLIRSNTKWSLKVLLDAENKENLSIKLISDSNNRSYVSYKEDFIRLNLKENIIANGSNTANLASNQLELFYQLKIDDFRKIKAGEKNYQITFVLE